MAQSATIFKARLNLADMDRHHYQDYKLTLARHPSENDLRMMVRLIAFALLAEERLEFTKGLSTDDEPELWVKNDHGEIELWVELGQPDEKRVRRACSRAKRVIVVNYVEQQAEPWWQQMEGKLSRFDNLQVMQLPEEACQQFADVVERTMDLGANIQDGSLWLTIGDLTAEITPQWRKK